MDRKEYPPVQEFIKGKWPSGSEEIYYSLFCDDLPEDIIQNAMRKVNETEERRIEGIRSLKEYMKTEKGLTCSDDEVLILVLRNCKYDIKKSEGKLEKFLKLRKMVGDRLAGIDIKTIEETMDLLAVGVLPYRDRFGRFIWFTRPVEKVINYEMDFLFTYMLSSLLFHLSLPMASLFGLTYIADSDCSSIHVWYVVLKLYRRLITNIMNFPIRISRISIVNENVFIRWCYNIVRPILPRKIASRVSFLGAGYENLRNHFHPDILPNEFGGNLGPINDTYYRKKFLDFVQKLKSEYS